MEIIEFHDIIEFEAQEDDLEETPDLVELNSLEFFIKALLYFEEEANGQLCLSELSPASLVRSETQQFDINQKKFGLSQLLNDPISTRDGSNDSLLGELKDDRSITNLAFCNLDVNNIVGTNSELTSEIKCQIPT